MGCNPVTVWKQDAALNTYIFCLFLIGLPFTIFGTYIIYQLQVVGFLIGVDSDGLPCSTYCLVPFGNKNLDLNSVILYLNAMGFALGGFFAILISAYADFWKNKSYLVVIFIVIYGAVAVPAYWLKEFTLRDFNSLMALYVVYAVFTYILSLLLCMYIPHCMRIIAEIQRTNQPPSQQTPSDEAMVDIENTKSLINEVDLKADEKGSSKPTIYRKYGFKMSIMGGVGTTVGGIIALILTIILYKTLPAEKQQSAGLLVTTITGFLTIAGAVVGYLGLPAVSPKPDTTWNSWFLEIFRPFRDLLQRKNMLVMLLSYTIFVDTSFASSSVTSQLYFIEVVPDTLEYSLYSLAGNFFQLFFALSFFFWQNWRPPLKLEYWMIIGYGLVLIVPAWGCIGLANVHFGFKNRWEFYVQNLIFYLAAAIVNPTFRVLFSELVPKGSEIEWFGLQVILSCATSWVSYITNAPLQSATHQLRFPLVLCLIFLIIPVILEVLRCTMRYFKNDKITWLEADAATAFASGAGSGHSV